MIDIMRKSEWIVKSKGFVGGYVGLPKTSQCGYVYESQRQGESSPSLIKVSDHAEVKIERSSYEDQTQIRPLIWDMSVDGRWFFGAGKMARTRDWHAWVKPLDLDGVDQGSSSVVLHSFSGQSAHWTACGTLYYTINDAKGMSLARWSPPLNRDQSVSVECVQASRLVVGTDPTRRFLYACGSDDATRQVTVWVIDSLCRNVVSEHHFQCDEFPIVRLTSSRGIIVSDGRVGLFELGESGEVAWMDKVSKLDGLVVVDAAATGRYVVMVVRSQIGRHMLVSFTPDNGDWKLCATPDNWRVVRIGSFGDAERLVMQISTMIPPVDVYEIDARTLTWDIWKSSPRDRCLPRIKTSTEPLSSTAELILHEHSEGRPDAPVILIPIGRSGPLSDIGANGAVWATLESGGGVGLIGVAPGSSPDQLIDAIEKAAAKLRAQHRKVALWCKGPFGRIFSDHGDWLAVGICGVAWYHTGGRYDRTDYDRPDLLVIDVIDTAFHGKSAKERAESAGMAIGHLAGKIGLVPC